MFAALTCPDLQSSVPHSFYPLFAHSSPAVSDSCLIYNQDEMPDNHVGTGNRRREYSYLPAFSFGHGRFGVSWIGMIHWSCVFVPVKNPFSSRLTGFFATIMLIEMLELFVPPNFFSTMPAYQGSHRRPFSRLRIFRVWVASFYIRKWYRFGSGLKH